MVVIDRPPYPIGTVLYTVRPDDTLWLIACRHHTTLPAIAAVNPGVDMNHLYAGQVICVRPEYGYYPPDPRPAPARISRAEADLKNYLRMLWEQHIVWTRLVILSIAFDLRDVNLVTNRLLQNPRDFEAALKPLYGDRAASRFAGLFTDHLVIAAQLVKAAEAGNTAAAADAEKRWINSFSDKLY